MFEPKLFRRPLPPKGETQRILSRKKSCKGAPEENTESKETRGANDGQLPTPEKSQPISLHFPDFDSGTQVPDTIKRSFVLPSQPSGPPSFPLQKCQVPLRLRISMLGGRRLHLPSDFILQGLAVIASLHLKTLKVEDTKRILSRLNYEVLTSELIAREMRGPQEVCTILFSNLDLPCVVPRKPEKQMLLEKLLEERMALTLEEESSLMDEEIKQKKKKRVTYAESDQDLDSDVSLVSGMGCKLQLNLEDQESELRKMAKMTVLSCLMHRRTGLSLKAFFLSRLPDLSPLADFLVYLNLSFNYLYFFPKEVYHLKHLEVLKLRNNPIKFIPEDIGQMKNLKLLIMSFNLLTALPAGLFSLPNLQGLDVSYNELEFIPTEIGNLRSLTYLNLEGNLLYVLPCGLLKLQLGRLKVENNFLHAYFWNEVCQLQPQRLTDMAALCFAKHNLWEIYHKMPVDIQEMLINFATCDCCMGPLYGRGLQFIRIYRNAYGLRLPYFFCACSPTCYMDYVAAAAEAVSTSD
ncbi:leucine-rich repeat-containing protein 63 [Rhineura floridana]|uniref:leucine-rich repeat-containing protein 63 n=1 Tax=Rhineura floridana TaxID=261503 RepID=UPI002AC87A75|nr:leucine-rich repeat-containing protein 63 [Rhineura floridana]